MPEELLQHLLTRARAHEMTAEERREQAVSFVYGNLAIEDPSVTRDQVRRVLEEMEAGRGENNGRPRPDEQGE